MALKAWGRFNLITRVSSSLSERTSRLRYSPNPTMLDGYKPYLWDVIPGAEAGDEGPRTEPDWTTSLDLDEVRSILRESKHPDLKVLVLYGSLRERSVRECLEGPDCSLTYSRSYSRLMAFEASRILHQIGCDVRVYNPSGLPVKDEVSTDHPKVQELRELSAWSDAHFWCSPEQHGNVTAVFKNQSKSLRFTTLTAVDWIPLSTGSVRPTQGRILAIAQVGAYQPPLR
jgi:arsenic resistance protein ArsH